MKYHGRMLERFFEWIKVKSRLSERDLWWASFGQNIESEINGKRSLFTRPALTIKKLSRSLYLVAPTTSQIKEGKKMYTCLHQVRTIDHRRLSNKLGRIDPDDFMQVKTGFHSLYNK